MLEVCGEAGIAVELKPPEVKDLMRWEGAFVTSTSRLVLPIDWMGVPQPGHPFQPGQDMCRDFTNGEGTLVERIRMLVDSAVDKVSVRVDR